jgi:hypothetical protein
MEPFVTDDLDARLRSARPRAGDTDPAAFDAELLARVRENPIAPRRSVPRTVAAPVAGATLAAAAAVMFIGPGDVGGPSSSAAAVAQALHWLTPPEHTVLHTVAVEQDGSSTTTHEFWQSTDDPNRARMADGGVETAGDDFYDPSTNTIYEPPVGAAPPGVREHKPREPEDQKLAADKAKAVQAEKQTQPAEGTPHKPMGTLPLGDPIVAKVRSLLGDDRMSVTGREVHNGVDTWKISLNPDLGRPSWTLWVAASDGKPVELVDPGTGSNEPSQEIHWTTYEFLPDSEASGLTTLQGAHPDAKVVTDPAEIDAAQERLFPAKNR